jgi:hypothetical protein
MKVLLHAGCNIVAITKEKLTIRELPARLLRYCVPPNDMPVENEIAAPEKAGSQ